MKGAYGCEVLFDGDRAAMAQNMIESATGELCPCKQGRPCPLLPAAPGVLIGYPTPSTAATPAVRAVPAA